MFLEVAIDRDSETGQILGVEESEQKASDSKDAAVYYSAAEIAKSKEWVDDFFRRFDGNNDGFVTRGEVPNAIAVFEFYSLDPNADRKISRDELLEAMLKKVRRQNR